MEKRFFIIIACCLFACTIQSSEGSTHSLANSFSNRIWQTLSRWFSSFKKPLLASKKRVAVTVGVGALAIAGAVWWYKHPPKNLSNYFSEIDRKIVEDEKFIDQSEIEKQNRKKEFLNAQQNIENVLNQIEQKKIQQPTTRDEKTFQIPEEQVIPQVLQAENQEKQVEQQAMNDRVPKPEQQEKVPQTIVAETSEEKKRKQTEMNYQVNNQLQEFKLLLDEYDKAENKESLQKDLKEKFDQLLNSTFPKQGDKKQFEILKRRYKDTIKK